MRKPPAKHIAKLGCKRPSAGFTVLEMVIASASAVVLMGGLSSALYIGAQSLDVSAGTQAETRTSNAALAIIKRDLQEAISISELSNAPNPLPDPLPDPLTPTAVTLTVPDRDGDNIPETIRYSWSGIANAPLRQEYNGVLPPVDEKQFVENVQSFSLDWMQRLINGSSMTSTDWTSTDGISTRPFVLFVSSEAPDGVTGITTPSATEQERIDLIEDWDFVVRVISQNATLTEFNEQLKLTNVVYVSGETVGWAINTKLNSVTHGVVTESFVNAESLGFHDSHVTANTNSTVVSIANNMHYITDAFLILDLAIVDSDQEIKGSTSTLATDAVTLVSSDPGNNPPSLLILDEGDELADGSLAAGRRCQLPWGEGGFDPTSLNADGKKLMRRSIEWAAGAGEDTATPWIYYREFTEKTGVIFDKSITIDTPPNYAEGDLLIAVVTIDSGPSNTPTPPSGWTEILVSPDKFNKVMLGVWWKIASASEPPTAEFTWPNDDTAYGWIMRFDGHDPTNPIHATSTNAGVSESPTAPALTTTADDCLILRIGGFDDDNVSLGDAKMSGHTTIVAGESSGGFFTTSGAAAYQMQAYPGTSGTATFGLSGSEEYRTVTIAIAPDPNP